MKITPIINQYNHFDYQTKKLPTFEGRDSGKITSSKVPLRTLQALCLAAAISIPSHSQFWKSEKKSVNKNNTSANINTVNTLRIPQIETSPNAVVKYGKTQEKASIKRQSAIACAIEDYELNVFKDVKNLNAKEIRRPLPCIDANGKIIAQVINYPPTNAKGPLKGKTIIVNSGHGGYNPKSGKFDPGTKAVDTNNKVIEEWYKAQNFAEKLITELSAQGAHVVYMGGHVSTIIKAKANVIKNPPPGTDKTLFISLHCDASKNKNAKGQSILYYDNDDLKFAKVIKNNLITMNEVPESTFKMSKRTDLGVLKTTTQIPSILIELGFQSNVDDNKNIDWQGFQAASGKLITQGILQYFNPKLNIPTSVTAKEDFPVNNIYSKNFPIPGNKTVAATPFNITSKNTSPKTTQNTMKKFLYNIFEKISTTTSDTTPEKPSNITPDRTPKVVSPIKSATTKPTKIKIRHTVQAKETLYSISKLYQTTPEAVAAANGIKDNSISIGQILEFNGIAPAGYKSTNSGTAASDIEKKQQILNKKMIDFKPFITQVAKTTGFSESYLNYLVKIEIGYEEDINNIYKDKNENETVGIGHLVTKEDVKSSRFKNGLNNKQMFDLLTEDLLETERLIKSYIGETNYKKMNFRQKEALVDFVFNRGIGTLTRKSPKLMRAIKDGNWEEFAANLDYAYSGKKIMSGLCKRRLWEMYRACAGDVTPKILESAQKLYEAGYSAAIQEEKERKTSIIPGYNKEVEQIFGGKIKLK